MGCARRRHQPGRQVDGPGKQCRRRHHPLLAARDAPGVRGERLDAAGETERWWRRHARYYAELCERASPELLGPDEAAWARRIDTELDNIWAVLRWGVDAPAQDDADLALRTIIALSGRWATYAIRARWGLHGWADALLGRARTSTLSGSPLVVALVADWHTSFFEDDDVGEQLAWEALRAASAPDVPAAIELSYFVLATARFRQAPPAEALELLAEAHRSLDEAGAPPADHARLRNLSSLFHLALGDFEAARRAVDASLAAARATGSPLVLSDALTFVGRAWFSEDPERALAAFEESIALVEVDAMNSVALGGAAQLRARSGDRVAALSHLRTAIANDHDIGFRTGIGFTTERAIAIFATLGDDELAATCAGIVQTQVVSTFRTLPQVDRTATASPSAWDRMTTRLPSLAAPH